jgi:hypothetical protein
VKDTFAPVAALLALLAQTDFLDPGGGPDQSGDFRVSPGVFVALFGLGFLIAIVGHVVKSRTLVAIGVGLVFLSTVLVPILLAATR